MESRVIRNMLAKITRRFIVFAPLVLFAAVLALITATAWWPGAPDLASSTVGVLGGGFVGLIINPQNAAATEPTGGTVSARELHSFNNLRSILIVLTIGVCVVTGVSLALHATSTSYKPAIVEGAAIAALAALAGLLINLSKMTPDLRMVTGEPADRP